MAILIYRDCGIELIILSHSNEPRPTTDQRCAFSIFPAAGQLDELELAPDMLQMQPMNQWHLGYERSNQNKRKQTKGMYPFSL